MIYFYIDIRKIQRYKIEKNLVCLKSEARKGWDFYGK